jgi:hypothetical protein
MHVYAVPPEQAVIDVVPLLEAGVEAVGVTKALPSVPWPTQCHLKLADGRFVQLEATQADLEFKFEVFPIFASIKSTVRSTDQFRVLLNPPVRVTLLQTESWLDPAAPTPTEGLLGTDPIAQFVGRPGSVPSSASATCKYVGAIEMASSNGNKLLVATGSFPYSLHVLGFYEDPHFSRDHYVPFPNEA